MIATERRISRSSGARVAAATWVLAVLAALIGILPMVPLGLFVHPAVLVPAVVLSGGVLAGIAASWAANGLSTDGSRSRLVLVVAVAVVSGLVVVALEVLITLLLGSFVPMITYVLAGAMGIGAGATWAAPRWRAPGRRDGRDLLLSLVLVLAGGIVIAIGIPALCTTVVTCQA
jgi:hypothetical protein